MKCPRCQHENRPGRRFCSECGASLALACPSCGFSNEPGEKFCGGCSASLLAPATPRFASPESYTPHYLAEKILTSKSALEGERKQVTVLFADLKGSMELLADRDPEEGRKILDPVLERMMDAVHRYEGTVNQVMGDGIMALFGAPVAHEDHAVRACYAALRMQESVKRYAEEVLRRQGVPLEIRVGLNSGEVVVRAIGSDLHMDYTAVGQTAHLAARMEQLARPGTVLVTSAALELAEGFVEVKSRGLVPVKGLAEPVEIYELTGAGTAPSRFRASLARGLTRFVGRDTQVDQLRHALESAKAGHGQIVAVIGEPGVGKSRLFYEFAHSHRTQGWLILEGGSVSHGKATSYLPVIDLLKEYFKIQNADDHRTIRERVTGKLLTLDRSPEPHLAAVLALLDVPLEDREWKARDPSERRQRMVDAVKRLLLRESRVQPLLLVAEDLHWVDGETQAVLDALVESLPTSQLLMLVNYRPDYRHECSNKSCYSQLRLDPLPPESAETLLETLLGSNAALGPLKQLLIERTGGNPFFLEESVRSLVESRALIGERGAYRLAAALPGIQVPASVHAILAARIDRLPAEDKALLQAASAIGKDVPYVLLQAVAELSPAELVRGLADLQTAEFVYEAGLFPEIEYTFKHALTHEVAYGSLVQERRRALHTNIAEAMEQLYAGRLHEHIERLAHHALRGELWEKAVNYSRQAAVRATERSAYDQAVAQTDRALEALTHLPESRPTLELGVDIRTYSGRYAGLVSTGQHERLLENTQEALTLAERLGDEHWMALTTVYFANALGLSGEHARALEFAERASRMALALGDTEAQVVSNFEIGQISSNLGDYRNAVAFLERNVGILQGDLARNRFGRLRYPSVSSRNVLSTCLAELGEFGQAMIVAQESLRIAEDLQHPGSLLNGQLALARVLHVRSDFHDAIPKLERCLSLASSPAFAFAYPSAAGRPGHAYAMTGRPGEALPLLEQAADRARRFPRAAEANVTVMLGEAYLLTGRLQDARITIERALSLAREQGARGVEARALYVRGQIAAHRDPPEVEGTEQYYQEALTLAEELGMRPLVAHCHLGLGKLYRRTGKREQAEEHLTTATTMYREMGMAYWLEQAERETRKLA